MTEKGMALLDAVRSKRTAVVGMGVSNVPLAEYLMEIGGVLTLRDSKEKEKLSPKIAELEKRGASLLCGEKYLDGLDEDVIFRAPGLRPDIPAFAEAVKRGATLTSEAELFLEICPCPTVGITGSDGKTTTTTLTGLLLNEVMRPRVTDARHLWAATSEFRLSLSPVSLGKTTWRSASFPASSCNAPREALTWRWLPIFRQTI